MTESRHGLGREQGAAMTINFGASSVGQLPLAVFHDLTGTYTVGMAVMMALPVLSVLAMIKARPGGSARLERPWPKTDHPS